MYYVYHPREYEVWWKNSGTAPIKEKNIPPVLHWISRIPYVAKSDSHLVQRYTISSAFAMLGMLSRSLFLSKCAYHHLWFMLDLLHGVRRALCQYKLHLRDDKKVTGSQIRQVRGILMIALVRAKNLCAFKALWAGASSWWSIQLPLHHS